MSEETGQAQEPFETGQRPFLAAVRRAAGWRVSPRQLAAALEAIAESDEEATPERVAEVASAARGEPSARQRRHGELWRTLGAQLIVQGHPGDPAAQLAFVGAARSAARRNVSDLLLITTAIELAAEGRRIDPPLVGSVARILRARLGPEASPDEIAQALPEAMRTHVRLKRARRNATRSATRSATRGPAQPRPGGRRGPRPR